MARRNGRAAEGEREQRGFQSLPAVDKSGGKPVLDEPRVVDSPADFRVKMLDSTAQVRKMGEKSESRSVILAERRTG